MAPEPYNPLDKRRLGESVAKALLDRPISPLPPSTTFKGAGIYTIYYSGTFPPYLPIAHRNMDGRWAGPIYVGKAVPLGARKGGYGLGEAPGEVLYRRLAEHAASIQQAQNLTLGDFSCRFLAVDDIWIPLGEALLIAMFNPLWNRLVDGFGNHDPGSGRHNQQRSLWDVLHPGREWAFRLQPNPRTPQQIEAEIATFLEQFP